MPEKTTRTAGGNGSRPAEALTILFAGVGGQGIVMAGDVVAEAAFQAGMEVKKSEIHGLSRRFGSVSCQVRLGRKAHSPMRGRGGVDLLLATEAHEALRYSPYLKSGGTALVNRLWIASGAGRPDVDKTAARAAKESAGDVQAQADRNSLRVVWFDGTDVVHRHECPKCLNMYMVGALAELLPVPEQHWRPALRRMVPESHFDVNLQMFLAGREDARRRGLRRQGMAT
jgi:indolepyruvate ferredoxin oxidoreductase beta subunit